MNAVYCSVCLVIMTIYSVAKCEGEMANGLR
uniref:Uncharacterized protein n=1 Tax=Anguilla anguilla TaxID=7936 RepID=A0A0E9QQ11_ANGAN